MGLPVPMPKTFEIKDGRQTGLRASGLQSGVFAGTLALTMLWVIGQIARDWTWLTGLCFYIPSPFLAALLFVSAVFHFACRRRRTGALFACLALLSLCVVLFAENRFCVVRPSVTPGTVRLVHWNVGGRMSSRAQNVLLGKRAQVYVLSEIPGAESVDKLRAALGPEYRSVVFGNLAVIAAGDVKASGWLVDRRRMKAQLVTWMRAGEAIQLLVVDLPSEIDVHRDPLLREINRLIEQHQPDLVVGDFNAPRRSRALCELPDGYRHAYDTAGAGWGYSWPVPVPMYALDQCLYSSKIIPARYELESSISSDHRLQVFDFGLATISR